MRANFSLIRPIAVRLVGRRASRFAADFIDDLEGEGAVALVEAAETYRPEMNVPFSAYARAKIRYRMVTAMRYLRNVVALTDYAQKHGKPQPEATGLLLQMPTPAPDPEQIAQVREQVASIRKALTEIAGPERKVIEFRYYDGRTMREVGASTGVSTRTILRTHKRAIENMRTCLKRRAA